MENSTIYCDVCLHSFNNIYAGLLITYFMVVVPANGRALWLMMSSSNFLTEKMDLFKFSLLINDFVLGLAISVVIPGLYLFHQTAQSIWGFSIGLIVVGKPLFQCMICLERYLAVLHPHTFLRYRPLRYRTAISALACLVVTACCCLRIALCLTTNEHGIALNRFYAAEFLFLLVVDLFCCVSILWVLYRPRICKGNPVKKKAFNTVVTVQISMMCCYMPSVYGVAMNSSMGEGRYCVLYTSGFCCIIMSSCLSSLPNFQTLMQACVSR